MGTRKIALPAASPRCAHTPAERKALETQFNTEVWRLGEAMCKDQVELWAFKNACLAVAHELSELPLQDVTAKSEAAANDVN